MILLGATLFILLVMGLALYSLILFLRGISRTLERERNVHNTQVSELLDRLAWKEDKPYGLPPRAPAVVEEPEIEAGAEYWREVT